MNPNLMLNIGFWIPSKLYLRALAAFGVLLQLSMFGYASWATCIEMLLLDDQPPGRWALPVAIAGTCLLGFGMFMCAHVIDRSMLERTFAREEAINKPQALPACDVAAEHVFNLATSNIAVTSSPPKPHLRNLLVPRVWVLYWIRPGGQVIGDQTFDPFAYSD